MLLLTFLRNSDYIYSYFIFLKTGWGSTLVFSSPPQKKEEKKKKEKCHMNLIVMNFSALYWMEQNCLELLCNVQFKIIYFMTHFISLSQSIFWNVQYAKQLKEILTDPSLINYTTQFNKIFIAQWIVGRIQNTLYRAPFLAKIGPGGTDSPHFCMGRDCHWDSEEQHRKWTAQPCFCMGQDCLSDSKEQHREWNEIYILSLATRCPIGSLGPYKSEEHQFCTALLTERTVCRMPYCAVCSFSCSGTSCRIL